MTHPKMRYTYIGVDMHKETLTAVALDCFYEPLGEITFRNSPAVFERFLKDMSTFKVEGTTLLFGLEDISAYGRQLAAFLLQKNIAAKHVHAGLVASERKSLTGAEKTDSIDALCVARVLLNKLDKLPDVKLDDKYQILQGLVIRRRHIVKTNISLKNHLHSFLTGSFIDYDSFFSSIGVKTALAFYDKYPSPDTLKDVPVEELDTFLLGITPHGMCQGKAEKILTTVEKNGFTPTEYQDTRNLMVKSIIRQLRCNLEELDKVEAIIHEFMKHFDYKLESMRGIETVTAANLIAEIGDIAMFSSPAKLARYAGVAPVTRASGKSDKQIASQSGNRTLNAILYKLAIHLIKTISHTNKVTNSVFYHYYHKKLSEGKTTRQAIKCLQRRLVTILWNMMTYKTEYINPPSLEIKEDRKEKVASKKQWKNVNKSDIKC